MIRAFIFDIGNVLLKFDFSIASRRLKEKTHLDSAAMLAAWEPIKAAYENGDLDRAEFQRRVMGVLRFTGTEQDFSSAWEEIFTENHAMTDLVRQLHGHYPLYLISNISDLHVDYIFRVYPIFTLFTDAVYSYRAKSSKPNREIFELAARQFQVIPAETIFLDDLAPNVEAALQLGFRAIQYDFTDHGAAVAALAREGVLMG